MKENSKYIVRDNIDILIDKYYEFIYRFVFSKIHNKEDTEDIVQDVFMKVNIIKKEFESETHFKNYLMKITINEIIDFQKSSWKKKVLFVSEEQIEEKLKKTDIFDDFSYKLTKLKPRYLTIIYMHYYDDLTIEEISRQLGISKNTACVRLNRARKSLRKIFKEDKGNNEDI